MFDCAECYVVQQASWQGPIENGGLSTKTTKVKNTKGAKEADSTLFAWSPYSHFFSNSCLRIKDPT